MQGQGKYFITKQWLIIIIIIIIISIFVSRHKVVTSEALAAQEVSSRQMVQHIEKNVSLSRYKWTVGWAVAYPASVVSVSWCVEPAASEVDTSPVWQGTALVLEGRFWQHCSAHLQLLDAADWRGASELVTRWTRHRWQVHWRAFHFCDEFTLWRLHSVTSYTTDVYCTLHLLLVCCVRQLLLCVDGIHAQTNFGMIFSLLFYVTF